MHPDGIAAFVPEAVGQIGIEERVAGLVEEDAGGGELVRQAAIGDDAGGVDRAARDRQRGAERTRYRPARIVLEHRGVGDVGCGRAGIVARRCNVLVVLGVDITHRCR